MECIIDIVVEEGKNVLELRVYKLGEQALSEAHKWSFLLDLLSLVTLYFTSLLLRIEHVRAWDHTWPDSLAAL